MSHFRSGQYVIVKHALKTGRNGDLIVGRVISVKTDGIVECQDMLLGGISRKLGTVLASHNVVVSEKIANAVRDLYRKTNSRVEARALAVKLARELRVLGAQVVKLVPNSSKRMRPEEIVERTKLVRLDMIDDYAAEPAERLSEVALKSLMASVGAYGVIEPVLLIEKDADRFTVVNGHRRIASARVCGEESIAAVVLPRGRYAEGEAFSLQAHGRRLDGKEWLKVYDKDRSSVPPKKIMCDILAAYEIFGQDGVRDLLIANNLAPGIVKVIASVAAVIGRHPSLNPPPTQRAIGEWIVRQRAQGQIQGVLHDVTNRIHRQHGASQLKRWIQRNEPFGGRGQSLGQRKTAS